jgi:hypothetical protein
MTPDEIRDLIVFCRENGVSWMKLHDVVEFALVPPAPTDPALGFDGALNLKDPFSDARG